MTDTPLHQTTLPRGDFFHEWVLLSDRRRWCSKCGYAEDRSPTLWVCPQAVLPKPLAIIGDQTCA